jgi:hypothetical protein
MNREESVKLLNTILNSPNSINAKILTPALLDFLSEKNIKDPDKKVGILLQEPSLLAVVIPKMVDFYRHKYTIMTIMQNNQIIAYE